MDTDRLIDRIIAEQERIWPDDLGHDFDGTFERYVWFEAHYGVNEGDDNRWRDILAHQRGKYIEVLTVEERAEIMQFLNDDDAVRAFLVALLDMHQHGTAVYGAVS